MNRKIIDKLKLVRQELYEINYLMKEEMEEQSSLLLELQEKKLPKAVDVEEEMGYLEETQELIDNLLEGIDQIDIKNMEVYH